MFLKIVAFFSRLISKISIPETGLSYFDLNEMIKIIQDGDIVLSRKNWELSNIFMPGQWKHCGIYLNGFIYEAVTMEGVRKISLEQFFYKKDAVGLSRYRALSAAQVHSGMVFLEAILGSPYQWEFAISNDKRYFCSELAYQFQCHLWKYFDRDFTPSKILWMYVIRPTDLWKSLTKIGKWGHK